MGCKSLLLLALMANAVGANRELFFQWFRGGDGGENITTTIDPSVNFFGAFEGWGTNLCWWSNSVYGKRKDIADVLFTLTNDAVKIRGKHVPTLGMNIVRYNAGGSATPGKETVEVQGQDFSMQVSPKMPNYKAIETFWVDWASNDTNSSSWDWTKDASQRTMLQLAKERGANIFELFSNSPPWWMTYTNASSGGTLLGLDNLREDQHLNFAYYLAAIAKHAQDEWGIEFDWIQPFNEPGGPWWIFPWTQEGCRFSILTQIVVIKSLRQQLDRMGLQSVSISASDENNPDQTLINIGSLAAIGRDALNLVGKINTHGYYGTHPYRGPSRGLLYRATSRLGKLLWNSEHGEGDASGINMAETISYDFNDMHVNGWVYWQPIDGGGWGLFDTDIERGFIRRINTKYYVLAQYSRHIRPGMRIMANDDSRTVVAYSAKRQLLVLVSVNTGDEAYSITYDLSKFSQVKGPINVWSTETESKKTLYTRSHLRDQVDNKTFEAFFQKKHVQTFEVHGVVL